MSLFDDYRVNGGSSVPPWVIIVIVVGTLSLIGLITWMALATDSKTATLVSRTWERNIEQEEYTWVWHKKKSSWYYPDPPVGSRNIHHSKYSESSTNSDGETEYETIYVTEYEIQEWVHQLTIKTTGDNDEPYYGEPLVDNYHRVGFKKEMYYFTFLNENKKVKKFQTSNFETYDNCSLSDDFIIRVNKFGFINSVKKVDGKDIVFFE